MKPFSAQITHVHHSGFIVETINHTLIFDYTEPDNSQPSLQLNRHDIYKRWIKNSENVFVFITHHHQDHFLPSVIDWQIDNPSVHVIAGYDVPISPSPNCHLMNPYEKLKVNEVSIESYGSTDEGVSFYVQVDNIFFFHSGDLNWWHWKEFSDTQQKQEEHDFKNEIQQICDKSIDVAFVPVDPRLEEFYYLAGEYFVETCKPSLMVPMHFGDHFHISNKFANKLSHASTSVAILERRGQEILFVKS